MENKYYTPEIEEFHVGFEYESLVESSDISPIEGEGWMKFVYPKGFIGESISRIKNLNNLRVKYLDKEDIESLGWMRDIIRTTHKTISIFYIKGKEFDYILNLSSSNSVYNINIKELYTNKVVQNQNVFLGNIKNKSELKKLMEQLGIKNKSINTCICQILLLPLYEIKRYD